MRSARVELILDTIRAVKGARELSQATDGVAKGLGETARQGEKAGHAVDHAGDQMSDAARAAAKLDREIDQLSASLTKLVVAQTLTGENFGKQIREQETQVRRLTRNRKLFGDVGKDAGEPAALGFAAKFSERLGPLMASLPIGGPLAQALGAAAVAAAPLLGATISAAVIGGAGIGGVIGGLVLASKDTRVQAAAEALAGRVTDRLGKAGGVFVTPTIQALDELQHAVDDVDLEGMLRDASRFVQPLAQGVGSLVRDLGSAVADLIHNAGPVIDTVGAGVAEIGRTLGDGLKALADNGPEAAAALTQVLGLVDSGLRSTLGLVNVLTELYGVIHKLGFDAGLQLLLKVTGSGMDDNAKSAKNAASGMQQLTFATKEATDPTKSFADRMKDAALAVKSYSDRIHSAFADQMSLDQAMIALRDGARQLKAELKDGTRTLSLNSVEGRKNRSAVLQQLSAIEALRQARFTETGSLQRANGEYSRNVLALRRSMLQAGYSKKAVDDLIGSYRRVPGTVDTSIGTPGLPRSDRGIKDYDKKLDALARQINTNVRVTGVSGAEAQLRRLLIQQQALKKGISVSAAASAFNKNASGYYGGGYTGRGPTTAPAGIVHYDEQVIRSESRQRLESAKPGALDYMNNTGRWPGYANGGRVLNAPFPVNAAMTRIPSMDEVLSAIGPGAGGPTLGFMVAAVRAAFPGMGLISGYRPGARTLSGNLSYHALKRATDWPASLPLAEWINYKFGSRTKELISPWNSVNLWNGRPHAYTGAIYRQHSGRNAHVHWAMANGGILREPVFGYGMRSGASYSLAERGPERVSPLAAAGVEIDYRRLARILAAELRNVTVKLDGRAVGEIQGRQADIYARAV